MYFVLKQGRHRAKPFRFAVWRDKRLIQRVVSFSFDCKYELKGIDKYDVNKLFGLGYTSLWKIVLGVICRPLLLLIWNDHHNDSARFGWFYNPDIGKMVILAYCYVNGERVIEHLCNVDFEKDYLFRLSKTDHAYKFEVNQGNDFWKNIAFMDIRYTHKKTWCYYLHLYFGGNNKSPKTMLIKMKKL